MAISVAIALLIQFWYIAIGIALVVGIFFYQNRQNKKTTNSVQEEPTPNLVKAQNTITSQPNDDKTVHTPINHVVTADKHKTLRGPKLACGYYYGEIILLAWLDGSNQAKTIPQYFRSRYGLNSVASKTKLIKDGLIITSDVQTSLKKLKVTDLKKILSTNNKKISGKKQELIERISTTVEPKKYEPLLPQSYSLSADGQQLAENNQLFIWAHQNVKSSLTPISDLIGHEHDAGSPAEITIKVIQQQLTDSLQSQHDFGRAYGYAKEIADISEQINNEQTLKYLFLALWLDYPNFAYFDETRHYWIHRYPISTGPQPIQVDLINYHQQYQVSKQQIEANVSHFYQYFNPYFPDGLYIKTNLVQIATSAITDTPDEFIKKEHDFIEHKIPQKQIITDFSVNN
ncbi:SAP domain-containing protein [Lapidilactobacillus bayanensis]|uniref:SAP domain-containing protein n=1 Tax=Lapidilactobacillus bayanensis TaxID=2485998 RepID=UPI0013DE629E|nr:SAP domain-containing protein [Lapidilactobacillus bayanensis]